MAKFHTSVALACFIGLVSGCVVALPPISIEPVGPQPASLKTIRVSVGNLVVYSALEPARSGFDDAEPRRSDYEIFAADGMLLKRVSNIAAAGEVPAIVPLAPGRYTVNAKANGLRKVTVPIVIEADKTTFVHLDGSELSGVERSQTTEVVRLPDGSAVGWRANYAIETK
ncbi:MAG TPA: hypothetical protein VET48_06395 [Steroidobacteraceae bacterium]|nr:hypothetical protein [Steroidobacteraceae bacterium]